MRARLLLLLAATVGLFAQDQTHNSAVLDGRRAFHIHLPASYGAGSKRFPVIYWLHGYEAGAEERETELAAWTAKHDAIVVDSGPAETSGNFPLYLAELASYVDGKWRTLADREHRAASGQGAGGFLALWLAATYPDLIGSASAISPLRSAAVGPRGFEVDTVLEDLRIAHDAVRTRLFNSGTPSAALDFHLSAFADPLPRPKAFSHTDPYPNFSVWGWQVISDRRRPGVIVLENAGPTGFRCVVRDWAPGGQAIPGVHLTLTSPKLFVPGTSHTVNYLPRTGKSRRVLQRADSQGRLTFELTGGEVEVGIGTEPLLAFTRFELADAPWASAGSPVNVRVFLCNKGAARSTTSVLKWDSPTPGVKFGATAVRVPALNPGETVPVLVAFTAANPLPGGVRIAAGGMGIEVPVYPAAAPPASFKIEDESDHDGHASPGESFTLSLPDGRAEIITADPCVDTSLRTVEDNVRYTHASIPGTCEPGRIVRMLARTANSYAAIEFPIWYKLP